MPKSISSNSFSPLIKFDEHIRISQIKTNQNEIICLAKNIYFEARGEAFDGKIAVGLVTINRLISDLFPRSLCSVVYQKTENKDGIVVCQFEWVCRDELQDHKPFGPAWKESRRIAKLLLDQGYYAYYELVDGALFFHANYLPFSWDKKYHRVAAIGKHIFYSLKR